MLGLSSHIGCPWHVLGTLNIYWIYFYLSQEFKICCMQKIRCFSFKILIFLLLELCCPGQPHHLPYPGYISVESFKKIIYSPEGRNFKYLPAVQFCYRQASLYSTPTFHKMINQFPLTCTFCFTVLHVKMQTCRNKTGNVYIMQHWGTFVSLHRGHFSDGRTI